MWMSIEAINRYKKSVAQILIRWSLQSGYVCIPKSANEKRIIENANVFDFEISDDDMTIMVSLCMIIYQCNYISVYRMNGIVT